MTSLQLKLGLVSLVGAGPGDPDLITVKGLKRLAHANVVAYDRLINPALLRECSQEVELILVNKSNKLTQEAINELLIDKAKQGLKVVRLKGGDPFVFGRGGEEALALQKAGIPFEIVPGVSSATAVPAYAGIPVTHRHISTSFTVVTGHEDPNKPNSTLDWSVLARAETLIVLMGLGNLKHIVLELIKHGRSPKTPAAIIHWGTMPEQKVVIGTLANINQETSKAELKPPATLVIGEVVGLHENLKWLKDNNLKLGLPLINSSRNGK